MDDVIGFLISRARPTADRAFDALVEKVWAVLTAKLGADSRLDRLRTEAARNGAVSPDIRGNVQRVLQAAAAHDFRFATELRVAMETAMNYVPPAHAPVNTGNHVGTIVAGGRVSLGQRIVMSVHRRAAPYVAAVVALIGLMAWIGYGIAPTGADAASGTATSATNGPAARTVDRSTPEATATGYVAALNDRDQARADQFVCADIRKEFVDQRIDAIARGTIADHDVVLHVTISATFKNVTTDGTTPVAHMDLVFSHVPDDTPETVKQDLAKPDDFSLPLQQGVDRNWTFCKYSDQ